MPLRADTFFLPQLRRFRAAGVTAVSLNIGYDGVGWTEHIRVLSVMRQWIAQQPDDYLLVSNADDILRAQCENKLAISFDIEGMSVVEDKIYLVQTFYELGVRWMLIAYNRSNLAGGGCMDEDGGLSATGRAIIDEMNRVGMVLCLSHAGERTARDALEYVAAPPIFSHSNPSRLAPHVRNVSDELMRLCAAKGGVVGLSGIGPFLGSPHDLVSAFLTQLHYVIDLVGCRHVGLGLDYVFDTAELEVLIRSRPAAFPNDVDGSLAMVAPESVAEIAEGLARANLTENEINLVLGGNWLRIAREVWK